MKDLEADIEKCPILKDKAKNLSPEEMERLRADYEKFIKPHLPAAEEKKGADPVPPAVRQQVASKPRHKRLKELRDRAKTTGCPFLNSSKG